MNEELLKTLKELVSKLESNPEKEDASKKALETEANKMTIQLSALEYRNILQEQIAKRLLTKIVALVAVSGGLLTAGIGYFWDFTLRERAQDEVRTTLTNEVDLHIAKALVFSDPIQRQLSPVVSNFFNGEGRVEIEREVSSKSSWAISNEIYNSRIDFQKKAELAVANAATNLDDIVQKKISSALDERVPQAVASQTASEVQKQVTPNKVADIITQALARPETQKDLVAMLATNSAWRVESSQHSLERLLDITQLPEHRMLALMQLDPATLADHDVSSKLLQLIKDEPSSEVRYWVLTQFQPCPSIAESQLDALLQIIDDEELTSDGIEFYRLREATATALSHFPTDLSGKHLANWLKQHKSQVSREIIGNALGKMSDTNSLSQLLEILHDGSRESRVAAWSGLSVFRFKDVPTAKRLAIAKEIWTEFVNEKPLRATDEIPSYNFDDSDFMNFSANRDLASAALSNFLFPPDLNVFSALVGAASKESKVGDLFGAWAIATRKARFNNHNEQQQIANDSLDLALNQPGAFSSVGIRNSLAWSLQYCSEGKLRVFFEQLPKSFTNASPSLSHSISPLTQAVRRDSKVSSSFDLTTELLQQQISTNPRNWPLDVEIINAMGPALDAENAVALDYADNLLLPAVKDQPERIPACIGALKQLSRIHNQSIVQRECQIVLKLMGGLGDIAETDPNLSNDAGESFDRPSFVLNEARRTVETMIDEHRDVSLPLVRTSLTNLFEPFATQPPATNSDYPWRKNVGTSEIRNQLLHAEAYSKDYLSIQFFIGQLKYGYNETHRRFARNTLLNFASALHSYDHSIVMPVTSTNSTNDDDTLVTVWTQWYDGNSSKIIAAVSSGMDVE